MKNKDNTISARTKAKNIHISQGGRDLTAQAGLIPVVKFFHKEGIVSKTEQSVNHQPSDSSRYLAQGALKGDKQRWGVTLSCD